MATRSTSQGGGNIITDGLVLYLDAANPSSYPGSGTTWYDLVSTINSGSLTNGPTYDFNNLGSILFDGSNDYVNLGIDPIGKLNSFTELTFTFWFKPISPVVTQAGNIFNWGDNSGIRARVSTTSKLEALERGATNTITGATTLTMNIWYQGAFTLSTTSGCTLYLNGIQDAYSSTNYTPSIGSSTLLLGIRTDLVNEVYKGNIASFFIYKKKLSSTEIQQNYNALKARFNL